MRFGALLCACTFLAATALGCVTLSPVDHALSLMRQERRPEAEHVLEAELIAHPDNLPARKLLVRLLGFDGDLNRARAQVDELRKRVPKGDPSPEIELGHAYELAHRFEEALAAYDQAATVAPESPLGPREGGTRCARWGEVEEAKPRLEEAVRRGARDAETYHTLGIVLLHLKDFDGAADAYKKGLAADPSHDENLLGLATVALMRDDAAGALAAYDALVKKHPTYAAGQLGRKADAKRALDDAERLGAPAQNVAKQRAALAE